MNLHEIIDSNGSNRPKRRLGKGEGNGHGKTCGRGHKGGKARSGYSVRPGFEGGQIPLYRTLPQRGFSNFRFHKSYSVVNLGDLARIEASEIDREALVRHGLIRAGEQPIKVLGDGDIDRAVKVTAAKFSASAKEKIEKAGGEVVIG